MAFGKRKKEVYGGSSRPRRIFKPWDALSAGGRVVRVVGVVVCVLWVFTFLQVLLYRFVEPVSTPHMRARLMEQWNDPALPVRYARVCVPIEDISPNMLKAAILGEDGRFLYHHGFSYKPMRDAYLRNEVVGHVVCGGSGISQQTAKNCFLPFKRNLFRKLVEAHYTFLIEKLWGKKRIMECYLNMIEFGNGIYGCEAASWYYYNHSSKTLTREEAAQLVAMLPNPREVNPHCHTEMYDVIIQRILYKFNWLKPDVWDGYLPEHESRETSYINRGLPHFAKWVMTHELKKLRLPHDNQDLENSNSYDEKEEDKEKPSQSIGSQTVETAWIFWEGMAGTVGECAGPVGLHYHPGAFLRGVQPAADPADGQTFLPAGT